MNSGVDAAVDTFGSFKEVAPYLSNPLVLIGFTLLLLFGIHRVLMRSGIIAPLSSSTSARTIQALLRYGFGLSLAVVILGFGLQFYTVRQEHATKRNQITSELAALRGVLGLEDMDVLFQRLDVSPDHRAQALRRIENIRELTQVGGSRPTAEGCRLLGMANFVLGRRDDAAAAFQQAVKADPQMGDAYLGLAATHQARGYDKIRSGDLAAAEGELREAERYARLALQHKAASADIHAALGHGIGKCA